MGWRLATLWGTVFIAAALEAALRIHEDGALDGTCWKIIGFATVIIAALSTVVGVLWNANGKLQEALLQETQNGKAVLKELYERMLERARRP